MSADLDQLRQLAETASISDGWWTKDHLATREFMMWSKGVERAFIAAASPAVVLDLIARVKTAEAQVERVLEWAHIEEQRASVRELSDPNAYARRCVYSAIIERLGGDA